jgi:hypothetical protein
VKKPSDSAAPHHLTQIERILQINELRTITKEVVEAAHENLVIGPS